MSAPYSIEPLNLSELACWDESVYASPTGCLFNTREWLELTRDVFGHEYTIWGCFRNGNLVAGLPAYYRRQYGLKILSAPLLTPYHGLIYTEPAAAKVDKNILRRVSIQEAMAAKMADSYDFSRLLLSPAVLDIRGFQWQGWTPDVNYTFILDLASITSLHDHISSKLRRLTRKAEEAQLQLSENDNFDACYELWKKMHHRRGLMWTFKRNEFTRFLEMIVAQKLGRIVIARTKTGEPCGFQVGLYDRKTGYILLSAVEPAYRDKGVMAYVRMNMLEFFRTRVRRVDFLGANIKSVATFKSYFGGELVPYFGVSKSSNWRAALAWKLYPLLTKVCYRGEE